MKRGQRRTNGENTPLLKRTAVVDQLANMADTILKLSADTEEQSEALELKKILQRRKQELAEAV